MTFKEAMAALEKAGTAQCRKIYARHGVAGAQFGVSSAALGGMTKAIKTDHALATALWKTGNYDACILATMIADPEAITEGQLDSWAKDLDSYCLTDAFAKVAMKTPLARAKAAQWAASSEEWIGRAGWHLHAFRAMSDRDATDAEFETLLATIEREIHARKNRVRDAMNSALIAIGARNPRLTEKALAAAKRIGIVDVDHGETSCKTPDAAEYIAKMLARQQGKSAAKAAARPASNRAAPKPATKPASKGAVPKPAAKAAPQSARRPAAKTRRA
jgi:3-methyladenine DNA glycosylase AlkD